jgi:hypothetical protein
MPSLAAGRPPVPPPEIIPPVPLGQCDATASGSEDARVRLSSPAGRTICLCAHHFLAHELSLAAAGWQVIWDDRPDPPPPRV